MILMGLGNLAKRLSERNNGGLPESLVRDSRQRKTQNRMTQSCWKEFLKAQEMPKCLGPPQNYQGSAHKGL
jgi:hypothetical protein